MPSIGFCEDIWKRGISMFGIDGTSGMEKFHGPSPGAITVVVCRFSPTVAVSVCIAPARHTAIFT